jgi:hypothetical protein
MEFAKPLPFLFLIHLAQFLHLLGWNSPKFYFCFTYVSEVLRVVLAKPLYFFMLSFGTYSAGICQTLHFFYFYKEISTLSMHHDIQQNNIQHNDTQNNNLQQNNTQYNNCITTSKT